MIPQNDHGIFLSHAVAGSLSTVEPCCQLHIQHHGVKRQHTSSDAPALTTNDATPTHEVLTNFVLNLAQPIRGADCPSGLQVYAAVVQA